MNTNELQTFLNRTVAQNSFRFGALLRLASVLALSAFLLVLSSTTTYATPPTRETIYINETFPAPMLTGACGFPVTGHIEGTVTITTFVNQSGDFIREIDSYHLVNTFAANGHTLTGRTSQQIQVTLLEDGSYTVAFNGTDTVLTLPGAGVVFGNVGRLNLLFSADNELLEVLQETGQSFQNTEAICAALAP
jgi:hypothetical protein